MPKPPNPPVTRLVGALVLAALCWPVRGAVLGCFDKRIATTYSYTDPGQGSTTGPSVSSPAGTPAPLPPPTTFVLTSESAAVPTSVGRVEITARALDANGEGMAGQPVALGISRGQATLDATTGVTDANGLFTTTARATAAGTVGIRGGIGNQNRTTIVTFIRPCNANVSFAAPVSIDMNITGIRAFALGDLNDDALYDLVAVGDTNRLTILLGDGAGSLNAMPGVRRGDGSMLAVAAIAVDITGDGLADAVTSYNAQDSIGVWVGDGHGGFSDWYNLAYGAHQKPALGDLDNDGRIDIVSATYQTDQEAVGFGQAQSGFTSATLYSLGGGNLDLASWSALGDFNGDAQTDIVVGNDNSTSGMSILMNAGKRTFQAVQTLRVAPSPGIVTTADFNNDEISDLMVTSPQFSGMYVILGKGDGTFNSPTLYSTVAGSTVARAADLDGDGDMDIVTIAPSPTAYVYLNSGNGQFATAALQVTVNAAADGFALADFDGDGRIDIVSPTSDGAAVTLNTCD